MHSGQFKMIDRKRMRVGITGTFGVPGEYDNDRKVMEFCAGRGLCVGNTYFKSGNLHKYARVARGQNKKERGVKSMIDLVLVKGTLHCMQDVRTVRGMGPSISDHHVVLCKVKSVGP